MKKILIILLILHSTIAFSQKSYTKISKSNVDSERVKISELFIKDYFSKCENKDFSPFTNFILDKRFERRLRENFEEKCEESLQKNGKLTLKNFNAAYLQDYSKNKDPMELIVFDADFEKSTDLKFVSVWIFRDQNIISGIWVSKDKP